MAVHSCKGRFKKILVRLLKVLVNLYIPLAIFTYKWLIFRYYKLIMSVLLKNCCKPLHLVLQ